MITSFPFPPKYHSDCRFPETNDVSNYQEYDEEPIDMDESSFEEWRFFAEDNTKPCWSYVGTDKSGHCILQRRYRLGTMEKGFTYEKRFFIIKRNIMASCIALAFIEDYMSRKAYEDMLAKLDRLIPPTGDPAVDGPPVLVPHPDILNREAIRAANEENARLKILNKVVWEDSERKLFFAGTTPKLIYKGKEYHFSGNGYEPMATILDRNGAVAYIHNSFLVEEECAGFVNNPKYKCSTITGNSYNAKQFCMLLTTAVDWGFDWQIGELEDKMLTQFLWAKREIFYKTDDIEFGHYGDDMDDDREHFENDVMYIIVDGKKYHLEDANMDKLGQLGIFEEGRRKPKIRIHGTNGSVIAAYCKDWRSGKTFTPFGRPCNTKMFCNMVAYAIRDGKSDYDMVKLEKMYNTDN